MLVFGPHGREDQGLDLPVVSVELQVTTFEQSKAVLQQSSLCNCRRRSVDIGDDEDDGVLQLAFRNCEQ